jgi:hypothetical protein
MKLREETIVPGVPIEGYRIRSAKKEGLMSNQDEKYDPNAFDAEKQRKAAKETLKQQEEDRRREQLLNVSTMLTTDKHIGKVLAEPHKEQEVEDLKVGTFERIGRLHKVEHVPLETEGLGVTDHVVTKPFPLGGVGGAAGKPFAQRVQEVLDKNKPKEDDEGEGGGDDKEGAEGKADSEGNDEESKGKEKEQPAPAHAGAAHKAKKR